MVNECTGSQLTRQRRQANVVSRAGSLVGVRVPFFGLCCSGSWVPAKLRHWFSSFPMLHPFDPVLHVAVIPKHHIISLLLHACDFTTVLNHNVSI